MKNNDFTNVSFDFEALELCPLCGSEVFIPNGKIRWHDIDFWYVICPRCGLKFMNPRPTKESYKEFYQKLFWEQKIRNLGFHQEGQMWQTRKYKWDNEKIWNPRDGKKNRMDKQREQRTQTIISAISSRLNLGENSDVLEVGCGFGVTLDKISKRYKCRVFAIEPSLEVQKTIKEFGRIKLLGGWAEDLESLSKGDLKFDVIIFSHVLENTIDPLRIMRFAKDCLKERGVIYIQTPNLFTFDQMNPYHPYIFSSQTLKLIAQKAGLEYKRVSDSLDKMLAVLLYLSL